GLLRPCGAIVTDPLYGRSRKVIVTAASGTSLEETVPNIFGNPHISHAHMGIVVPLCSKSDLSTFLRQRGKSTLDLSSFIIGHRPRALAAARCERHQISHDASSSRCEIALIRVPEIGCWRPGETEIRTIGHLNHESVGPYSRRHLTRKSPRFRFASS